MKTLTVGEIHPTPINQEGAVINYDPSQEITAWELSLGFSEPRPLEIVGFQEGIFRLRLIVVENIPFICFMVIMKTQGQLAIPWHECPVHSIVTNNALPTFPKDNKERILIPSSLIDINTGRIEALRAFTLSNNFSHSLCSAIAETANKFSSIDQYQSQLQKIWNLYTPGAIAKLATTNCISGS